MPKILFWIMFVALIFSTMQNESMRIENRDLSERNEVLINLNKKEIAKNVEQTYHVKEIFREQWQAAEEEKKTYKLEEDGQHRHEGIYGKVKKRINLF